MSEPAGTCHVCDVVGKPGERWINSDTCDACQFEYRDRKWRERSKGEPRQS